MAKSREKKAITAWVDPEIKVRVDEICKDLNMSASAFMTHLCKYAVDHRAELAGIIEENVSSALLK